MPRRFDYADRSTADRQPAEPDGPPAGPAPGIAGSLEVTVTLSAAEQDAIMGLAAIQGDRRGASRHPMGLDLLDLFDRLAAAIASAERAAETAQPTVPAPVLVEVECPQCGDCVDHTGNAWSCVERACGWSGNDPAGVLVCPHCGECDVREVNVAEIWLEADVRIEGSALSVVVDPPIHGDWSGAGWVCARCSSRLTPPQAKEGLSLSYDTGV